MALPFYNWSRTAGNNATADSTINWQEGQAPSSINDSARAMMASTAAYRDDISGATYTTGSGTAYALATYQVFSSNLNGEMLAFTPHATNGTNATLSVDGNTARPIYTDTVNPVPAGVLVAGTPYVVTYDNVHSIWILNNYFFNPYSIPVGGGLDYWGATAPNSSFAFPSGQAISRTTYAGLFGIVGTTYGSGDGSTTFNLPDKTGRVSAMKEASASRLTSTYFGGNSTSLGATGGVENNTIGTTNLPPYTPSGSISISSTSTVGITPLNVSAGAVQVVVPVGQGGSGNSTTAVTTSSSGTVTMNAQGGASTPIRTVQPTIVCNYIIRIL